VSVAAAIRARVRSGALIDARFAAASLVDAIGTGCFLAGSALFFTRDVGLSPGSVGLGLTVSGVIGFLTTVPWGRAADRWGAQRILVTLLAVRAMAFVLYAFATSFAAFLAIAVLVGLVEKSAGPIQQVLVGDVVGEARRQHALAVVRTMRNVGFAVGALAATAAVSNASGIGYDGIVLLNAMSFVIAAVLMGTMRVDRQRRSPQPPPARTKRFVRDRGYAALTAVNGVLTLHMSLLSVGLPLWLIEHTRVPVAAVPLLLLVNTVLAVAFQVPVAGLVRSPRSARVALTVAGVALAGCCLAMPVVSSLGEAGALAVTGGAVLALTLAELAQSAGGWDLSFRHAPEAQRGRYLSVFSLGMTAQTIVGPLLLTAVVFALGWIGWALLAAVLLGAGLLAGVVVGDRGPRPVSRERDVALCRSA
jgi:MFS family permease